MGGAWDMDTKDASEILERCDGMGMECKTPAMRDIGEQMGWEGDPFARWEEDMGEMG